MPLLTLPPGLLPAAGDTIDADPFTQLWYAPYQPDESFAIINGGLDATNMTQTLTEREVRGGTQQTHTQVGRTANLDYFRDSFNIGVETSLEGGANDDNNKYLIIPGGSARKYLPWAPKVVQVRWMIAFANDAINNVALPNPETESSQIKLFVDGEEKNPTKRGCRLSNLSLTPPYYSREVRQDRHYHGHFMVTGLTVGWHNFSLRVIANARQTRIRVTNLSVIAY